MAVLDHRGLFRKVLRAKVRLYGSMHPPPWGGVGSKTLRTKGVLGRSLRNKGPEPGNLIRDILFLKLNQRPPQAEKLRISCGFGCSKVIFLKEIRRFRALNPQNFQPAAGTNPHLILKYLENIPKTNT